MSIEVMTAVWEHSTAYGGDLLILLAIANYADIHGRAYPSIGTLAQRGRMTERNAQYCIQKLEALGELKVERNAGPHGTHVFHILITGANFSGCKVFTHQRKGKRNKKLKVEGEKIAGAKFSGVQSFQTEAHFTGGVKPISPEPSLEPSVKEKTKEKTDPPVSANAETSPKGDVNEPAKKIRQPRKPKHLPSYDPDGYQAFLAEFPRHSALPEAVKAWDWLKPDPELQAMILADIAKRKAEDQKWADGFITHPSTYLRGERWRDDITPHRFSPKPHAFKSGPTHAGLQQWLESEQRKDGLTDDALG